jgi:alpha-amylase
MDTAKKTADYMNDLIDMGVVGFRVDASKHMWPAEDAGLYALLHDLPVSEGFAPGSKAWLGQEVIDQGGEPIKKEQYTGMGCVTEFNYCFSLANLQNSLAQLKTLADTPSSWGFLSDKDAFVFVNNHDNQRGHGGGGGIITFEDPHALKVATGIMMALPYGKKRIMSSYFFSNSDEGPPAAQPSTSDSESGECTNGWVCEHRWPGIKNLGMLEGAMNLSPGYENWWDNGASQAGFRTTLLNLRFFGRDLHQYCQKSI